MMNTNKSPQWHTLKNGLVLLAVTIVVAFSATFETKVIAQSSGNEPMVIINGKKSDQGTMQKIDPENIQTISINKDGENDVIEVTTKDTLISQNAKNTNGIKVYRTGDQENPVIVVYSQKRDSPVRPENMEEVEVIGYGSQKQIVAGTAKTDEVKAVGYTINNKPKTASVLFKDKDKEPLILLDGKRITYDEMISNTRYQPYKIIEGKDAVAQYGEEAKYGVLLVRYTEEVPDFIGGIAVRSRGSNKHPLIVVNGKAEPNIDMNTLDPKTIKSIEVLKAKSAIALYGDKAKDGVVLITLKDNANTKPERPVYKPEKELILAPNPTSDNVQVSLGADPKGTCNVKVYSKFGELVYQDKKTGSPFTISVSGWKTGVYIVVVEDGADIYKGSLSVVH